MRIKCLAEGHNMLMRPGFEPSIDVSRNQRLSDMTNLFHILRFLLMNFLIHIALFIDDL